MKIHAATATTLPTQTAETHSRKANFGALVSAIRHGDLDAAKTAYDALQGAAGDGHGWSRKGNLAAVGEAIASGNPEAAKTALKTFQHGKVVQAVQPPVVSATTDAGITVSVSAAAALSAAATDPAPAPAAEAAPAPAAEPTPAAEPAPVTTVDILV